MAGLAGVAGLAGCGTGPKSSDPAFLPPSASHARDDTVLTGTAARPALTSEGDPVEVSTPGWRVRATVTGPEIPGEGLPAQQPFTYCTWTVTLSGATGNVPVDIANFRPLDFAGRSYTVSLVNGSVVEAGLVPGGAALPQVLPPGRVLSFRIRAYEAVGEGLMRWAPDGNDIVAKWDYEVEND